MLDSASPSHSSTNPPILIPPPTIPLLAPLLGKPIIVLFSGLSAAKAIC